MESTTFENISLSVQQTFDAFERFRHTTKPNVAVTENTFSQLHTAGELAAGDIDVFSDITVSCSECGMHTPVREFTENDGCRCAMHTLE